jgi:hypothetical protein
MYQQTTPELSERKEGLLSKSIGQLGYLLEEANVAKESGKPVSNGRANLVRSESATSMKISKPVPNLSPFLFEKLYEDPGWVSIVDALMTCVSSSKPPCRGKIQQFSRRRENGGRTI